MGVLKDIENLLVSADDLNDIGIPSVSVALLQQPSGETEHLVITNGEENTDTVYQACSISKAITALAVAKLIDLRRLSYSTKIVDYIPEQYWRSIVEPRTEHLMQYVTVGMLVSHRSGLSQHGFPGYAGPPPAVGRVFDGQPPANTPRMRFLSFPGSQVCYSGGGFTMLQVALEHLMQMSFPELMKQLILDPLGMTRSCYGDLDPAEENYARAHLTAYTPGTTYAKGYHRFAELAAAGLWTTPTDLLKAISAVQGSLNSENGFLSSATAREMLTKPSPDDSSLSMAMGWGADSTFFAHAGDNDPGFTCYAIGAHKSSPPRGALQGHGLASLAIMTNSALGFDVIKKIVAAVFIMKSWPLYESLPCNFGKMSNFVPFVGPEGVFLGDDWKDFVGHWAVVNDDEDKKYFTPASTPGAMLYENTAEPTYEIYFDEEIPMVAFDGIGQSNRLRPGVMPYMALDGSTAATFVVDGLEMAFRLSRDVNGEHKVQLIMDTVKDMRRV